jgi:hypothetical protein
MCKEKEQITTSYFLVRRDGKFPIDLQHWWPEKEFGEGNCLFRKKEIKRALKRNKDFGGKINNNYMTIAICITPTKTFRYLSKCLSIDQPTRKYGRDHALGLLHKEALKDGYFLETERERHAKQP